MRVHRGTRKSISITCIAIITGGLPLAGSMLAASKTKNLNYTAWKLKTCTGSVNGLTVPDWLLIFQGVSLYFPKKVASLAGLYGSSGGAAACGKTTIWL